jgi:phage terminase small subunit
MAELEDRKAWRYSTNYRTFMTELGIQSAYMRLPAKYRTFVDNWIATGSMDAALVAAGFTKNSRATINSAFDANPDILLAIKEKCEELQTYAPSDIATQSEVLRELTYIMREGSSEEIRLKAAVAIQRHYNPKQNTIVNLNMKELLDEAEQTRAYQEETVKVPSR